MEDRSTFFHNMLYRIRPSAELMLTDDFGTAVAIDVSGLWKVFYFIRG